MIQRVQTLLLLGLIVVMALVYAFPIWEKTNNTGDVKFALDALQLYEFRKDATDTGNWTLVNTRHTFYLAGLATVSCLIALYSIFQYKDRLRQMKLGALNAFIIMAFVALATYYIYQAEKNIGLESRGVFKAGYFLPLAALILNSLANRFIKKDEKLVRSSFDRIR